MSLKLKRVMVFFKIITSVPGIKTFWEYKLLMKVYVESLLQQCFS